MQTTGNLITIDKVDVDNFKRQKNAIDNLNEKMILLRQKQIYNSLSESTKLRIEMFQKILELQLNTPKLEIL